MDPRYKWPLILVAIVIVVLLIYGVRSMDDSTTATMAPTTSGSTIQTPATPGTGSAQPQNTTTPPPQEQGTPDLPNTTPPAGTP